jgi:hypothetical protein
MRISSTPSGGYGAAEEGVTSAPPNTSPGWALRAGTRQVRPDSLGGLALKGFGFAEDPFGIERVLTRPGLLTRKTGLALSDLERQARLAAETRSALLLVGPEGSGKTLLLRFLARNFMQNHDVDSVTYFDVGTGTSEVPQDRDSTSRSPTTRDFRAASPKPNTLLLIDNADRMFKGARGEYGAFLKERMISAMVLGISYPTYLSISENESLARKFSSHITLPVQEQQEIERMLRGSVESCVVDGEPFEPSAYGEIAKQAMGLPGLAVDLAESSLLVADWVGLQQVTKAVVERTAKHLLYSKANDLISGKFGLQGTRRRIVTEVLKKHYMAGDCRRNSVTGALEGLAGSTVDYHAQKLAEEEVLKIERLSHRIRYEVPKPVRAALQIVMSRGAESSGVAEFRLRLAEAQDRMKSRNQRDSSYLRAPDAGFSRHPSEAVTSIH